MAGAWGKATGRIKWNISPTTSSISTGHLPSPGGYRPPNLEVKNVKFPVICTEFRPLRRNTLRGFATVKLPDLRLVNS